MPHEKKLKDGLLSLPRSLFTSWSVQTTHQCSDTQVKLIQLILGPLKADETAFINTLNCIIQTWWLRQRHQKQKREHLNRVILSWSPPHAAICQPRWLLTILESWFRSWQPCGLSCRPSWGISYRQTPCPSVCPSPGTARRIPSYAKESEEEKKDRHREKEKQTAKRWIWEMNME